MQKVYEYRGILASIQSTNSIFNDYALSNVSNTEQKKNMHSIIALSERKTIINVQQTDNFFFAPHTNRFNNTWLVC